MNEDGKWAAFHGKEKRAAIATRRTVPAVNRLMKAVTAPRKTKPVMARLEVGAISRMSITTTPLSTRIGNLFCRHCLRDVHVPDERTGLIHKDNRYRCAPRSPYVAE